MNFGQNPSTGSDLGPFLKIEPGETVVGVFRGEPHEFYVKWENQKSNPCDPAEKGAKFRFRVNFIVNKDGVYQAFIWEQGAMVYNQLKEFNADYPLEKTIVKITRHGKGLDTMYGILPKPGGAEVGDQTENLLRGVKLNDLTEETKPVVSGALTPPAANLEENIPF